MRPVHVLLGAALAALVACTTFDGATVKDSELTAPPRSGSEEGAGEEEATSETSPSAVDPQVATDGGAKRFAGAATPEGCIVDVTAGDHVYSCEGLTVDATIPPMTTACPAEGCGLIVELHGDTGSGPLIDGHLRLRERAAPRGYIVLAPTGPAIGFVGRVPYPGSTWAPAHDAKIVAITKLFAKVFKANPKRIHATGFSRGGLATWRLACDQSTLFASVAPGGAGNATTLWGINQIEPTCFTAGHNPARPIPILSLVGRTDVPIPYGSMNAIINLALKQYGIAPAETVAADSTPQFVRNKSTKAGAPAVEWFDHAYETLPTGPMAAAKGHCIPGSKADPQAARYAYGCNPTPASGFDWGAEVLAFFERTPMP